MQPLTVLLQISTKGSGLNRYSQRLLPVEVVLTTDVQVDGVTPFSVWVLEAAVQSVMAAVHFSQQQSGTLYFMLGVHVRPVHLPCHRRVVVQGAALHGHVTAHLLILVSPDCKHTDGMIYNTINQRKRHRIDFL